MYPPYFSLNYPYYSSSSYPWFQTCVHSPFFGESFNSPFISKNISIQARVRVFPQEESVWWCLDVFFVLLGLGEGEGLDHQQQVHYQPCVEGVEKASERLSKAILLSPFIEGSSSCSLFMSFTVCTRKNLHSCEGKL